MTTIPIEAEVSTEQLLRAVAQLPPEEFTAFVSRLLTLRAQCEQPRLSQQETALLLEINAGISAATQRRFDELVAKRQAESISGEERAELIHLTEQIEQHDARRLAALGELAQAWKMTLTALMDILGIPPPTYA